jgi:hypothetical protein
MVIATTPPSSAGKFPAFTHPTLKHLAKAFQNH